MLNFKLRRAARRMSPLLALGLLAAMPTPALAHAAYLLPNLFSANQEDSITLQSSFAEHFFRPELAVDSDDWHVLLPDGTRVSFATVTKLRQVVILESDLKLEGTYRFTTGVRRGRLGKVALVDGKWQPVRGEAPAGAQVRTTQTETVSDVYVTKKGPTRAAVDAQIGRLVLHPVTHPSDIAMAGKFDLAVLFDGKPLPGVKLEIDRGGADYDAGSAHREVTTGPDGRVSLTFYQAGAYVVMARHRADAPAGSTTDERSYTTALTFEVQR
ncbi:MAG: nickel uptake transporter family protein [Novosphingobium sp.]|nr:nickel uptake transporter family protein [Novosphingobium sp.]